MDYAWLETNETGAWENWTIQKMDGFSGWSNFTWQNPGVISGTIEWKIYANDTSGNLNVTSAMSFQVIPSSPAPGGPEGGTGGPSGTAEPVVNFTVDKEFLKAVVKQGETLLDYLKINNTGKAPLDFKMEVEGLNNSIMLSEDSFSLKPGETKAITVAFTAREGMAPDIYSGRLVIKAVNITKAVVLIMEVKARKSLFDLYVSLEETPLEVSPGQDVEADILMYNFGDLKPVDVVLYYALRDFQGNDIVYNHETMAIEEQKLVKRKIRIPKDIQYGFYLFYARLEYTNQTATSAGLIKVVEKREGAVERAEEAPTINYMIIIAFSVMIISSLLIYLFWRTHIQVPSAEPGRKGQETKKAAERFSKIRGDIENLRFMLKIRSWTEEGRAGLEWVKNDVEKLKLALDSLMKDRYFEKEVIIAKGTEKTIKVGFKNDEKEGATASLYLEGLLPAWYSVSPGSAYAGAGKEAEFKVRFSIPDGVMKGVHPFNYFVKMGGYTIVESASLVITETEKEMLQRELDRLEKRLSEIEDYYGVNAKKEDSKKKEDEDTKS
ncbi:MAG: hypothetical protein NTY20_04140 [Candidatus Aenigmarchaeota archaeon]|nr:hypothetical protein [Candidatus Aenigmarchaeota archaeon]